MVRKVFLALLCLTAGSCGPGRKAIRSYVGTSPHQKIAILPFTPAPGRPNSGQEAADIFSESLGDMGFQLVNRADLQKVLEEQKLSLSGALKPSDAIKLGQLLGVQALLTGTVSQADEETVRRPPVYDNRIKTVIDRGGNSRQVVERVRVTGEQAVKVPVFSATVRLTDVESGHLLWVGSGSDHIEGDTIQEVAEGVLGAMAEKMGRTYLEKRL